MTTIKRLKVSFVDKDTMKVVDPAICTIAVCGNGELAAYKLEKYSSIYEEVEIRVEDGGSVINI